jgi:hypothetical protein
MGRLLPSQQPNTRMLYACQSGTDEFTSTDPGCEGRTKLAELGWIYTQPPAGVATVTLTRCLLGTDHFDSLTPDCEGQTKDGLLGYPIAYAALVRYRSPVDNEHATTVYGTPPGYLREGTIGLLSMVAQPGTKGLYSCRDGLDEFASPDSRCEGKTVYAPLGQVWDQPPAGLQSTAIYRCHMTSNERFVSARSDCEGNGNTMEQQLGYVLMAVPAAQ